MQNAAYQLKLRGWAWRDDDAAPLTDPETLLNNPAARILKRSERRTVARVVVNGRPLILKLFDESSAVHRLESSAVGSAASRAARSALRMQRGGFPVPELVAVLERGRRLRRQRSCLVTIAIDDGIAADEMWRKLEGRAKARFMYSFARYVSDLHARGLYPQDLWPRNILVQPEGNRWRFVLVDLDRVRSYAEVSWRRRLKNLVQIERSLGREASDGERLRFLRAYFGAASEAELKRVGAEILRASQRKDAEYARRRRRASRAHG
jgi:tRNA A-37 threonylcarbamoyl transferase component Bud32